MKKATLIFCVLGCKPQPRLIEQHDVFFGIGKEIHELAQPIKNIWPETNGKIHIDGWRRVTVVDKYHIRVVPRQEPINDLKLFFFNLGGYTKGNLYENHKPAFIVSTDLISAVKKVKTSPILQSMGSVNSKASAHVDDKFSINDNVFEVQEILWLRSKFNYSIQVIEKMPQEELVPDELHQTGFLQLLEL